jgi:hypothetical protein
MARVQRIEYEGAVYHVTAGRSVKPRRYRHRQWSMGEHAPAQIVAKAGSDRALRNRVDEIMEELKGRRENVKA